MKVYKTRNVQAQLEYPTISTQPVAASGDTLVTAMNVSGLEFLTAGTKFKKLQANGTASGAMTNLTINGNISQATPTNLTGTTEATGTLAYNTNTPVTITYGDDVDIYKVVNDGTAIVTISGGKITDYSDPQINYLDSNITFAGIDSITFYPTALDANKDTNAGATVTTSPYNFKYGSTIGTVTMSGTLNVRYSIGGKPTIDTITIALGTNTLSLTDNQLLQSINSSGAKEATLIQTEVDIITAIGSGGGGGGGGLTLAEIEASTVLAKEATSQSIKTKVDTLQNTDLTGIALEATSQKIKAETATIHA
jgi:hypothetical protein